MLLFEVINVQENNYICRKEKHRNKTYMLEIFFKNIKEIVEPFGLPLSGKKKAKRAKDLCPAVGQ